MASISYNKKTRTFTVVWKDYTKLALGESYPYGRKSEKWNHDRHPSPKEKREIEKRLMTFAADEEHKSKNQADYIQVNGIDKGITASGYLTSLSDDELSITSRQVEKRNSRRFVNNFVLWLDKRYKKLPLHKINEAIAREYYKHLESKGITFGTIIKHRKRLAYIFKQVIRKYEDSPLKYKNPFATLSLDEVITKQSPHKRKPYNDKELQDFLHYTLSGERIKTWQMIQRFSIFYFLIVTGWRISDIIHLTWKQIDFDKRIIRLTHSKTQNQGIKTELFITDLMIEILSLLKQESKNDFIFLMKTKDITSIYHKISAFFKMTRQKMNLDDYEQKGKVKTYTYTIHSFRHTVITRLTQAGYQEARINYLVGHAPRTIEEKHYLHLESFDTKNLVEHLESIANIRFYYDLLLTRSHGSRSAQD